MMAKHLKAAYVMNPHSFYLCASGQGRSQAIRNVLAGATVDVGAATVPAGECFAKHGTSTLTSETR